MAHGLNTSVKRGTNSLVCKTEGKAGIGSRRIFAPQFKLQVLDSYRNDVDCKGNQRATARKYGIHRRQIQKWLQVENNLRNSVIKSKSGDVSASPEARKCVEELALRSCEYRQRDDVISEPYSLQRQLDTEAELEYTTLHRIGGADARDTVDKRVPDIPQHSPTFSEQHWLNNNHQIHPKTSPKFEISQKVTSPVPIPSPFVPINSPVYKCECPEALPLDYTTHSRHDSPRGASPFADAAPIDLSLKKPYMPYPRIVPEPLCTPVLDSSPLSIAIEPDHPPADSQIWDLSTKGIKRPLEDDVTNGYSHHNVTSTVDVKPDINKPVKLFKPYLLDQDDSSNSSDNKNNIDLYSHNRNVSSTLSDSETYFYNNNNEYSYYKDEAYPVNITNTPFYCSLNSDYYPNLHYVEDKNSYLKKNSNLIKQRQSYSLDFKLSAIQCYYSDDVCKGNQRAVATKYKIHRRQVQKWLKQEDELRQRNETSKHMHIVR